MKIAQVTCVWPPYGGGVGVVARSQTLALARLGHEVTVFTPAYHGQAPRVELEQGVRIEFLQAPLAAGNAAWLPQLTKKLAGFDIVHLHLYFIGATRAVLQAVSRFHVPLVVQYHNDLLGRGLRRILFRVYTRVTLARLVRASSAVLGLSTAHVQGSDLVWALPQARRTANILPNGVEAERFCPGAAPTDLAAKLGLGVHEQVLLFVGGLDKAHYFKGVPELLQAMVILIKAGVSARLLMVGTGDLQSVYAAQASKLGLSKQIIFVGGVSQADLPPYYRLAQVFVLPSVAVEAFPVAVVEAMACGLPVVVTALPGPASMIEGAGVVVPVRDPQALADALKALLASASRREELGKQARALVESGLTWDIIGRKLESIYQRVISQPKL